MISVFVYGTLKPGQCNHDLFRGYDVTFTPATIPGRLYGYGLPVCLVLPDDSPDRVHGYVATFDSLSLLNRLDRLEGVHSGGKGYDIYERLEVTATLETGETVEAFVYGTTEAHHFFGREPIPDGVFGRWWAR